MYCCSLHPTRAEGNQVKICIDPASFDQMLPSTGLFQKLTCPYYPNCPRITCIYSHDTPPSVQGMSIAEEYNSFIELGISVSRKRKAATDLKNKSNDPGMFT